MNCNSPASGTAGDVPAVRLAATLALHDAARRAVATDPAAAAEAIRHAADSLTPEQRSFGGLKQMQVALTALLLDDAGWAELGRVARTLHSIVEQTLAWVFADRGRLATHFPDHRRMFPWLRPTPGARHWQGFSRYDVVVTPAGRLKVIELNTGCPAGFMQAGLFTHATTAALRKLQLLPPRQLASGAIDAEAFVDRLLAMEAASGIEPGLVAVLNDENELLLELDLLEHAFRQRGRDAAVLDARTLTFAGGRLRTADGRAISLAYDKFRISVPTSANHCWRDGFETRYAGLLAAVEQGAVVAVNNLAALTVAEDKGLLALFREPEVQERLSDDERRFVADHVMWTTRLVDGEVEFRGRREPLLELVRRERESLVIKPANEGRGFGVHIGRDCTPAEWEQLCTPDPATPRVVQEYIAAAELPVAFLREGADREEVVDCQRMFLTLGLACVGGDFLGVLSRVSTNRVTNVARDGMVQAVLCEGGGE